MLRLFSLLITMLFPARCSACAKVLPFAHHLCPDCWHHYHFISHPLCHVCGLPFSSDLGIHPVCGKCLSSPPLYHSARAAVMYTPTSRQLIARFKYHDKTAYHHLLSRLLYYAGRNILPQADLIIPVPLHRKRLFKRRYNQSALLAQTLSHLCGVPAHLDILKRYKNTSPQATLKRKDRIHNVKNAFAINPKLKSFLYQKHLILVDDVMTTGSTIHACTDVLLKAGAKQVDVLTIARAPL